MAKLSKSDAAKAAGVSRQTLYTYIKDGRISVDAGGLVDTAELLRAGFTLHALDVQPTVSTGQTLTSNMDMVDVYRKMVEVLEHQLAEARARAHDDQAQIAWLRLQVDQVQQRYDRLLDAPRPAPPPVPQVVEELLRRRPYADLPEALPRPQARLPEAWQRILTYLQAQRTPLRAADVARALGRPAQTVRMLLARMAAAGVLERVARGRYALPEGER